MRNKTISGAFLLLQLTLFYACNQPNHNTNVSVLDSDDLYEFSAYYPSDKINSVEKFINKSISPNTLFTGGNDVIEATTNLGNDGVFHIKARDGKMRIRFDKKEHSPEALERVKQMCNGVREILVGKGK